MHLGRRAALLGALAGFARPAAAACAAPYAQIGIDTSIGPCTTAVLLDDQPARMIVDTGSERTVLTRAGVARFALPLDEYVGTAMRGAGGRIDEHRNAIVHRLTLGGVALEPHEVSGPLSLPVVGLDMDGLIGGDALRHFALDFNFATRKLGLRAADSCVSGTADIIAAQVLRLTLLTIPVHLDGHLLTALVDTGSSASMLNARGLSRMGLTPALQAADPVVSSLALGGRFAAHRHRFSTLQIGRHTIQAPALLTLDAPEPAYDLILGLDLLSRQNLLLSYSPAFAAIG